VNYDASAKFPRIRKRKRTNQSDDNSRIIIPPHGGLMSDNIALRLIRPSAHPNRQLTLIPDNGKDGAIV